MLLWNDYSLIAFTDYNCFGKTKTSKERQPALLAYADNVLKNFKKKLDKLDANYPKFYKERTSENYVISADDLIISTETMVNSNILS